LLICFFNSDGEQSFSQHPVASEINKDGQQYIKYFILATFGLVGKTFLSMTLWSKLWCTKNALRSTETHHPKV